MGAVKKAFKGLGGLLGFGGSSTPSVQQVATDPTPTSVQDVGADTQGQSASLDAKNKKRRGFASTQTSTILGNDTGSRSTLG